MRAAPNTLVGVNYIPDNPRMEVPPLYFLQRIHDFDNMLVLFPSRKTPFAYVIARRRQFSAGLTDKAIENSIDQPDTKMVMAHGCVPVCLMYKTGASWDPDQIIRKLAARDLWAMGGADKVADMLEEQEAKEKAALQKQIRDDLYNRSGDAWRSYQHRTGQSTIRSTGWSRAKANAVRPSNSTPSRSRAGWVRDDGPEMPIDF
jgi:hypothetical protein